MEEVIFVTHNKGKIASAQKQLKGVNVKIYEYELEEPRSDDISYISKYKVTECLSYYDGKELHQFMGKHEGTIANEILGNDTEEKWSDLWYIFIPAGYNKTLAQMTKEERTNRIKHESIDSMQEFAKWYFPN